jgi:hypothetical protein
MKESSSIAADRISDKGLPRFPSLIAELCIEDLVQVLQL